MCEYSTAIRKNESLPFAATCIDLENIMLSEISQTGKDKYCMISLMWDLIYNTNEHLCKTDSQM